MNVKKFVHKNDAAPNDARQGNEPNGKNSLDDLKVQPPKSKVSRNAQGDQRGPVRTSSRAQSADRREPDTGKAFYDTDATSVGRSSTAASVRHNHSAAVQAPLNAHHRQYENGHSPSDSVSGSGEDEEESDPDEHLLDRRLGPRDAEYALSEEQQRLMATVDRGQTGRLDGRSMPYMKGDSYPTTTSGRPSVADSIDHRTQPESQRQKARAAQKQSRQPVTRQSAGTANGQALAPETEDVQRSGALLQAAMNQRRAPVENVVNELNAGFSFGKASKPLMNMQHRPGRQQQQNAAQAASEAKMPPSNNTAQRASLPTKDEVTDGSIENPQYSAKPKSVSNVRSQAAHMQESPAPNWSHAPGHEQKQFIRTQQTNELPSEAEIRSESEMLENTQTKERPLDYDPEHLFNMAYEDLKAQSFDSDPNRETFKLQEGTPDDSLSDKLSTVSAFHPVDQSRFFASLTINEWEETGDWFLNRFGEFIAQLKSARQQKRQAARLFEDEIERREKSIVKKRKQTDDALNEMRESGGRVLQGTPKKTRTK